MRSGILYSIVTGLLAFQLAACGDSGPAQQQQQQAPDVGFVTVKAKTVTLNRELPGRTTAHQIGVSDTLLVAANTTGGVTGKMISPQSIAVACAATGLVGKESELFRFTVKHSLLFAVIVGIITMLQAYVFTGMIPH